MFQALLTIALRYELVDRAELAPIEDPRKGRLRRGGPSTPRPAARARRNSRRAAQRRILVSVTRPPSASARRLRVVLQHPAYSTTMPDVRSFGLSKSTVSKSRAATTVVSAACLYARAREQADFYYRTRSK